MAEDGEALLTSFLAASRAKTLAPPVPEQGSRVSDQVSGENSLASFAKYDRDSTGGPLSPRFVEWLMGFPTEWLSLEPLEMHKFRNAWLSPGRVWLQKFLAE
jgi:hypothetical protein